jgi:hypothetical protein
MNGKMEHVCSMELWELFEFLNCEQLHSALNGFELVVVVENPNLDSHVFRSKKTTANMSMIDFRKELAKASDVGKNKGIANAIITFLQAKGIIFLSVAPSERQRAENPKMRLDFYRMPTKSTHEQFCAHTGWTATTNEHARDAAMLVFRLTRPALDLMVQKAKQKKSVKKLVESLDGK